MTPRRRREEETQRTWPACTMMRKEVKKMQRRKEGIQLTRCTVEDFDGTESVAETAGDDDAAGSEPVRLSRRRCSCREVQKTRD